MAFSVSCLTVCALVSLLGLALFPNLVTSSPNLGNSLTIYTAASSEKTLKLMLIVALIGAVVASYARASVIKEIPGDRSYLFYTNYLLCLTGLWGDFSAARAMLRNMPAKTNW